MGAVISAERPASYQPITDALRRPVRAVALGSLQPGAPVPYVTADNAAAAVQFALDCPLDARRAVFNVVDLVDDLGRAGAAPVRADLDYAALQDAVRALAGLPTLAGGDPAARRGAVGRRGVRGDEVTGPPAPRLSAAVEVAAFRIASEAMTNAARHSGASRCLVGVELTGTFELTVSDNGRGTAPDVRPGVGWTSMRERAAELGGSCTITSRPGGGLIVRAVLPLGQNEAVEIDA
jgi:hypothetical protein